MKKKFLIAGAVFVLVGIFCGWMQNTYYGTIDENGVLRDSLFLPLFFLFTFLGGVTLIIGLIVSLKQRDRPR